MPVQELIVKPNFFEPSLWPPPINVIPSSSILSKTESKLCIRCQAFFFPPRTPWTKSDPELEDWVQGKWRATSEQNPHQDPQVYRRQATAEYIHFNDLDSIFIQAETRKCHLCVLVRAKLFETIDPESAFEQWMQRQSTAPTVRRNCDVGMCVSGTTRESRIMLLLVREDQLVARRTLSVTSDIKVDTTFIGKRLLQTSTSSEESFITARNWLDSCLSDHTKCSLLSSRQNVIPRRLLDVTNSAITSHVKLHETLSSNEPYRYVTLSHCWGQTERLVLTNKTVTEFIRGISLDRLALTFRHAIEITRRLRIQYLWIDSLCIIQDSPNGTDWVTEASKMASIYGAAVVNIFASASSDSHGGCFRDRSSFEMQPLRFERYPFPMWQGQDSTGPALITIHDIEDDWKSLQGPLDARGWILQEQILAPRTLHYTNDQIFWECRQLTASEVWPAGVPMSSWDAMSYGESKVVFDETDLLFREDSGGWTAGHPELLHRRWHTILERYTCRSLTRASDKFPALSGIADKMGDLIQDTYLAGLWRQTLIHDLAWMVVASSRGKSWPAEYRAPSWSWASIDGVISYDTGTVHEKDMECTIHDVEIVPLNNTSTGRIRSGKLTVSGLIRHSEWIKVPEPPDTYQLSDAASAGWLDTEIDLYPDVDMMIAQIPRAIVLFQLFRSFGTYERGSPYGRRRMQGLMLIRSDNAGGEYRRIGFWRVCDFGYSKITGVGWNHFVDGWKCERIVIL